MIEFKVGQLVKLKGEERDYSLTLVVKVLGSKYYYGPMYIYYEKDVAQLNLLDWPAFDTEGEEDVEANLTPVTYKDYRFFLSQIFKLFDKGHVVQ